jgi:hypothetical protein
MHSTGDAYINNFSHYYQELVFRSRSGIREYSFHNAGFGIVSFQKSLSKFPAHHIFFDQLYDLHPMDL